jgi:hypothetical protein
MRSNLTGRDLLKLLQELPPEALDLPICTRNDEFSCDLPATSGVKVSNRDFAEAFMCVSNTPHLLIT